ncbi:MAG TPA: MFS transporter, partial [Verrucomicrobiae bacterium]
MAALAPVHQGITSRKLKAAVFVLEGLNSLSTTYYFYYLYFYTREKFQFGTLQNLWLAAGLGFLYAFGSLFGGRFAQKFGYFTAIELGVSAMLISFFACAFVTSWQALILLTMMGNVGMSLVWPAVEALASEGELPARLPAVVGLYNLVWSVTAALAYFTGGLMMDKWGARTIFFLPAAIMAAELVIIVLVHIGARRESTFEPAIVRPLLHAEPEGYKSPIAPQTFLKMAWIANPMAYIAANTVIPTIPSIAKKMAFTPAMAGFVCSLWFFTRTATFIGLRLWPGWHYRFRFLASTYIAMIISFAGILLAPNQWILLPSEALFGIALGLIYYSSLFYSMDVGETKGEHGGLHEAAIGFGNGTGPAVAAITLTALPSIRASGTLAVCGILIIGLAALFWIRFA